MTDTRQAILDRLAEGESLSSICRDKDMPAWGTVHNWMNDDAEFDGQVTRAREIGYQVRADKAVADAKAADDAAKGRLAFDAERWYLGKLSNAFSDDKARKHEISGSLKVEGVRRTIYDPRNPDSPDIHPAS